MNLVMGLRAYFRFFKRWSVKGKKRHYVRRVPLAKWVWMISCKRNCSFFLCSFFFGWVPIRLVAVALRQAGGRRMSLAPCAYLDGVVPLASSLHSPQALSACCARLEEHSLHHHYRTGHCQGAMSRGLLHNRPRSEMSSNGLASSCGI